MTKTLLTCLGVVAVTALSGCSTVKNLWDNPEKVVPSFLQPYRAPVQQGNLVTDEMVNQLEKGMSQGQVQFLLGIPLVADQFHPNRWDYVYYLLPSKGDQQLRQLSVFFDKEGRLDHWTSSAMPDEKTADMLILEGSGAKK